ncbi:MAG: MATE family efflux transporter [Treponema sp.]|jgi:putative MATE family efflux protein|nr:MATE family efflux transporter [Treponema sp.]
MTKNLTVGNPALLIISFAIPLFIGNLFQQFYNMADTLIVGRTIGVSALAAVGCTGSINFFILGFVWGFTQGTSIITSQRFGAGDEAGVRRSFAVSIFLSVAVTLVLTAVSVITARKFLVLMRTPAEILDGAYNYIIVIYWGIAASVIFNLFSNMMRAVGDSKTPLVILVIACIINIILDFVFILVFHTGVEGAAYATVIAQVISGLLCIPVIRKKLPVLSVRREDWRFSRAEVLRHLKVAFPMGFQLSIIAIGVVAVQFAVNSLGTLAVAAFTAGGKIEQLGTMPMGSFGAAMTTYVAQNYGARKVDRIQKGIFQCLVFSGIFSVLIAVIFFLAGPSLTAIFVGRDPEVISLAHTFLKIEGSCLVLLSCLFVCRQSLLGLSDGFTPTVAGIMELVMRMFGAVMLPRYIGFAGVCWAGPLAWLGAAAPLFIAVLLHIRRLNRELLADRRRQDLSRRLGETG